MSFRRGALLNPSNKFHKNSLSFEQVEGIDEPTILGRKTEIIREYPKTIISKVTSPDLNMAYSINPYQGCEHGCAYCYARNSHEYWGFSAGVDFESKIMIKPQAAQLLESELSKRSWKVTPISLSGNTDCYQPLERKLKITRSILEVFQRYRHPVGLITKNALITRDIDILEDLAKDDLTNVWFSINTLNKEVRRKMEPRTSSADNKFQAMEKLAKAGVPVNVMLGPVIPGLTDHEIPEIIRLAAEHGARDAGFTVVRLNGALPEIFGSWIKNAFPDRADKVLNQIKSMHGGQLNDSQWGRRMKGEGPIAENIHRLYALAKKKYLGSEKNPKLRTDLFISPRSQQLQLF